VTTLTAICRGLNIVDGGGQAITEVFNEYVDQGTSLSDLPTVSPTSSPHLSLGTERTGRRTH
jgi:hypothetical protein